RVALYVVGGLCALCAIGVVAPEPWLKRWLLLRYGVEVVEVEDSTLWPILRYCLRIACAVFAVAGAYFLMIARRPRHYDKFVRLGIVGLVSAGLVALVVGSLAGFAPPGHYIDGAILWAGAPRVRVELRAQVETAAVRPLLAGGRRSARGGDPAQGVRRAGGGAEGKLIAQRRCAAATQQPGAGPATPCLPRAPLPRREHGVMPA
ncbi:MAG: hypothetical protein PVH68_02765, partial [Armatimonadota bacterium]